MAKERILFVGLACFDVVNVCDGYPLEDSDTRAIDQEIRRGGNASNSCTCYTSLLSWLKNNAPDKFRDIDVEFFGTMGGDAGADYMTRDFKEKGILLDNVVRHDFADSALAVVTINSQNGSRSIIHCIKNLPELSAADFEKLDISKYSWIHLEARKNIPEIMAFMSKVAKYKSTLKDSGSLILSVEIEKPFESRTPFLTQIGLDYIFVSKDYAKMRGCTNIQEALDLLALDVKNEKVKANEKSPTSLVVAWGETGAGTITVTKDEIEKPKFCPSFPPKNGVVDTTGAGDAFIAGVIFARHSLKLDMEQAITFGAKFAGAKCGTMGNKGLDQFDQFL